MLIKYCSTATYRNSVTANMHLIGERYFLYRYRIVIMCSVTWPKNLLHSTKELKAVLLIPCYGVCNNPTAKIEENMFVLKYKQWISA